MVKDLFFFICFRVGVIEMIGLIRDESWFFVGELLGILEGNNVLIWDIFILYLILNFDLLKMVIFFIRIVERFVFGNVMFVGVIFRNFFSCLVCSSNWIWLSFLFGFLFGWVCIVKVFVLKFWLEILLLGILEVVVVKLFCFIG